LQHRARAEERHEHQVQLPACCFLDVGADAVVGADFAGGVLREIDLDLPSEVDLDTTSRLIWHES
jgi:hypothetical protein